MKAAAKVFGSMRDRLASRRAPAADAFAAQEVAAASASASAPAPVDDVFNMEWDAPDAVQEKVNPADITVEENQQLWDKFWEKVQTDLEELDSTDKQVQWFSILQTVFAGKKEQSVREGTAGVFGFTIQALTAEVIRSYKPTEFTLATTDYASDLVSLAAKEDEVQRFLVQLRAEHKQVGEQLATMNPFKDENYKAVEAKFRDYTKFITEVAAFLKQVKQGDYKQFLAVLALHKAEVTGADKPAGYENYDYSQVRFAIDTIPVNLKHKNYPTGAGTDPTKKTIVFTSANKTTLYENATLLRKAYTGLQQARQPVVEVAAVDLTQGVKNAPNFESMQRLYNKTLAQSAVIKQGLQNQTDKAFEELKRAHQSIIAPKDADTITADVWDEKVIKAAETGGKLLELYLKLKEMFGLIHLILDAQTKQAEIQKLQEKVKGTEKTDYTDTHPTLAFVSILKQLYGNTNGMYAATSSITPRVIEKLNKALDFFEALITHRYLQEIREGDAAKAIQKISEDETTTKETYLELLNEIATLLKGLPASYDGLSAKAELFRIVGRQKHELENSKNLNFKDLAENLYSFIEKLKITITANDAEVSTVSHVTALQQISTLLEEMATLASQNSSVQTAFLYYQTLQQAIDTRTTSLQDKNIMQAVAILAGMKQTLGEISTEIEATNTVLWQVALIKDYINMFTVAIECLQKYKDYINKGQKGGHVNSMIADLNAKITRLQEQANGLSKHICMRGTKLDAAAEASVKEIQATVSTVLSAALSIIGAEIPSLERRAISCQQVDERFLHCTPAQRILTVVEAQVTSANWATTHQLDPIKTLFILTTLLKKLQASISKKDFFENTHMLSMIQELLTLIKDTRTAIQNANGWSKNHVKALEGKFEDSLEFLQLMQSLNPPTSVATIVTPPAPSAALIPAPAPQDPLVAELRQRQSRFLDADGFPGGPAQLIGPGFGTS